MAERRVTARLSISRLKRRGERSLPCAMPESTQREETEPPRRSWDRVPHRKLARRCQRDPVTPKSKRRTRVASTQKDLNVDECVTAEAQGVYEAESHGVGTKAETALGRVELWNVGGQCERK